MSEKKEAAARGKEIIRASIVGIAVNVLLAAVKAAIGLLSNSIAIILDAVNNLSDALSSMITILGTWLAGKKPDKKHPLGYGRIEYLSALIISIIVLYAGITALVESGKKLIQPEPAQYSVLSLVILGIAVIAKILLGTYMKKTGERLSSGSLVASGSDALNDAILSSSVIATALLYLFTGLQLEAIVGVVIAGMIIRSGIELIRDTINDLLGARPDSHLSKAIKATAASEPEVEGAYDLVLHSYGPDTTVGSVHIEVPDTMTAKEIDDLERRISMKVYQEHHVLLTGISIYAKNTGNDSARTIQNKVTELVMAHDGVLQMHGFYVNQETKAIGFDIVMDYASDRKDLYETIREEVSEVCPGYQIEITVDNDLSD
ncbi:MAG: cation transporter [Solobacterium sp.]|nr:cation transporter [Solobacterium sp.]